MPYSALLHKTAQYCPRNKGDNTGINTSKPSWCGPQFNLKPELPVQWDYVHNPSRRRLHDEGPAGAAAWHAEVAAKEVAVHALLQDPHYAKEELMCVLTAAC